MSDPRLLGLAQPEPVLVLDAVKALVALAVGLGWVMLTDAQVALILTAAGAVLSLTLSVLTRSQVTPNERVPAAARADGDQTGPIVTWEER